MFSHQTRSKIRGRLHCFAAFTMLFFAISHLAARIKVADLSYSLANPVFPFITNGTLFLIAAAYELCVALLCFRARGHDLADIAVLTFVGSIAWYRWALNLTGGTQCGCLGILGRLLHVGKNQEKIIPICILILLFLTTTPFLLSFFKKATLQFHKNSALLIILLGLSAYYRAYSQQAIEIYGSYDICRYNPKTRQPFLNTQKHIDLGVTISGMAWKICATNSSDRADWEEVVSDGTNTYTLCPYITHFVAPSTVSNLVFATVSSSTFYSSAVDDRLGLFVPWLHSVCFPGTKGSFANPQF